MTARKPGNAMLQRGENDLRDWYVIGFIVFVSSLVTWLPLLGAGRWKSCPVAIISFRDVLNRRDQRSAAADGPVARVRKV